MREDKNKIYGEPAKVNSKSSSSVEAIKQKMDYYIGRYVYDKADIRKARGYYFGYRNNKDYAYLEDNYGIGTPAALKFTPTISSRIDILTGLMLSQDLDAQVFPIDKDTIDKETEEALNFRKSKIDSMLSRYINTSDKEEENKILKDTFNQLKDGTDFISSFQKSAQDISNMYMKNTDFNFDLFKEEFFRNILTDAESVFKETKNRKGEYPGFDICLSEDTFYRKSKQSRDIETSPAIVHRRYMTKHQILIELGQYMNREQKIEFLTDKQLVGAAQQRLQGRVMPINAVDYGNAGNTSFYDGEFFYENYGQFMGDIVEVVHVEYKEAKEVKLDFNNIVDKVLHSLGKKKKETRFVEARYSGYRIGNYYYVNVGLDKDAKRNTLNPSKVQFTYHGVSFNEYMRKPTSIAYKMLDVQDFIDIIKFHRENLIANSSVNSSRLNVAAIPTFLGKDMMERVKSWIAISKQGKDLVDPTLPGANLFQHYGSSDGGVDGNMLNAIDTILMKLDQEADLIAGINPTMRGIVEQREAVSNVKTGVTMISYSNKHYFKALDNVIGKALTLLLDNTKIAFPDGFSGAYYNGANKVVFNHLPESYLPSQFIVSIRRDDMDTVNKQKLISMIDNFASNGIMKPMRALEAGSATSTYELNRIAEEGIKEKEEEDNILEKTRQQLDQTMKQAQDLAEQNKEMAKKLELLENKMLDNEKRKIDIKEREVAAKIANDKEKTQNDKEYKEDTIQEVKQRTKLEQAQLLMSDGNAKEVRNLKV